MLNAKRFVLRSYHEDYRMLLFSAKFEIGFNIHEMTTVITNASHTLIKTSHDNNCKLGDPPQHIFMFFIKKKGDAPGIRLVDVVEALVSYNYSPECKIHKRFMGVIKHEDYFEAQFS